MVKSGLNQPIKRFPGESKEAGIGSARVIKTELNVKTRRYLFSSMFHREHCV
jgi:hypothetical protein